jgi:hypothetical protein
MARISNYSARHGEVAEWLKAAVLKIATPYKRCRVPVQIGSKSTRAPAVPYHLQARSTAFQTAGAARP